MVWMETMEFFLIFKFTFFLYLSFSRTKKKRRVFVWIKLAASDRCLTLELRECDKNPNNLSQFLVDGKQFFAQKRVQSFHLVLKRKSSNCDQPFVWELKNAFSASEFWLSGTSLKRFFSWLPSIISLMVLLDKKLRFCDSIRLKIHNFLTLPRNVHTQ